MSYRENYAAIRWLPVPKVERERIPPARSHLPAPMLIRDDMEPTKSMLDGKTYDSKARLRATYREAGVTELGNDAPMTPPPKPRTRVNRKEVRAAVARAFSKAGLGAV